MSPKTTTRAPKITNRLLEEIARSIADVFSPEKVILFGSYAWGNPHENSDVYLLVVMNTDLRPAKRSATVSMKCRPRFVPMDILVRTPSEMDERIRMKDPFIMQIVNQGKVLYAR